MLSVIIPALNEEKAIGQTIDDIRQTLTEVGVVHEIIVVDDGSTDSTGNEARARGVRVLRHAKPGGYGLALKDGIRLSSYDLIAITDADGTYPNRRLPELYRLVANDGYDMAIGARTGSEYRGTFFKMPARRVFLWLSEYASGSKIDDINSGLRVFRKDIAMRYMHTISNGFSFTTTITLASLLNGYFLIYVPIEYYKRVGSSHVRYYRDTLRTLQLIVESILYYNPLKLFLLLSIALGSLSLACLVLVALFQDAALRTGAGVSAAVLFASAFIVAAQGFAADLNRMLANRNEMPRMPWRQLSRLDPSPTVQADGPGWSVEAGATEALASNGATLPEGLRAGVSGAVADRRKETEV